MDRPRTVFDLFANPWTRVVIEALAVVLAMWLLIRLSPVVTPLLVGLVLAYILDPVVGALTRRRLSRRGACTLVFGSGVLVAIAVLGLSIPRAWQESVYLYRVTLVGDTWVDGNRDGVVDPGELTRDLNGNGRFDPNALTLLRRWLEDKGVIKKSDDVDERGFAKFDPDEWLHAYLAKLTQPVRGPDGERTFMARVGGFLGAVGYWLAVLVLVPIYAYVFSLNLPKVSRAITDHIPPARREQTLRLLAEINRSVGAFFRGRILVCAILGIVALVGFACARVPSFIVMAAVMGVATAVPLAPILVLIPVAGLLYLNGADMSQYIIAVATYAVVQGLEPVLISFILGEAVEMHPVLVLFSVLAFGDLLGPVGVVLAVPLAATVRILGREFLYRHVRRMAGLDPEPPASTPAV